MPRIGEYFGRIAPSLEWSKLFSGSGTEGSLAFWFYRLDKWGLLLFETAQMAALATLMGATAGLVLAFPAAGSVNGTLVLDRGDVNLTFKRYLQSRVTLTLEDDHITGIEGEGTDAMLMRRHLAAFDRNALAVSHVGWGMNPRARYEALSLYGQRDTNGTELRCVAGNFLFSTGANEFAGRYTEGHFDIPVFNTTITLDGEVVVREGVVL